VAFLDASQLPAANPGVDATTAMLLGANGCGDGHADGAFYHMNDGGDFGSLTATVWGGRDAHVHRCELHRALLAGAGGGARGGDAGAPRHGAPRHRRRRHTAAPHGGRLTP
jgi:hypothetical protein